MLVACVTCVRFCCLIVLRAYSCSLLLAVVGYCAVLIYV